jgi:hypothetical protein
VNLNSSGFQFIHDIILLVVKINTVEFKALLVMNPDGLRNQLFSPSSSEGFDEMEDFDFFIHWLVFIRHCERSNLPVIAREERLKQSVRFLVLIIQIASDLNVSFTN